MPNLYWKCTTAKAEALAVVPFSPCVLRKLWYNMHKKQLLLPSQQKGATHMNFHYAEKKVSLPSNVHAYAEKKVTKLQRYFRDEADGSFAVVYKRNDGGYGLIEDGE